MDLPSAPPGPACGNAEGGERCERCGARLPKSSVFHTPRTKHERRSARLGPAPTPSCGPRKGAVACGRGPAWRGELLLLAAARRSPARRASIGADLGWVPLALAVPHPAPPRSPLNHPLYSSSDAGLLRRQQDCGATATAPARDAISGSNAGRAGRAAATTAAAAATAPLSEADGDFGLAPAREPRPEV